MTHDEQPTEGDDERTPQEQAEDAPADVGTEGSPASEPPSPARADDDPQETPLTPPPPPRDGS